MFPIQYFIFLILKLFETCGIKLIKLRIRIKNDYLRVKKCLKRVMKNYVKPLLPSATFL